MNESPSHLTNRTTGNDIAHSLLKNSIIIDIIDLMAATDKILWQMRESPKNVRFDDLSRVCRKYFGEPRQNGTSHRIYKTPWAGDPRVNIQKGDSGKAKHYQVQQVVEAIDRLEAEKKKHEREGK